MRLAAAAVLALLMLGQQPPDYPGTPSNPWPEHQEPTPGWTCSPTGKGAHECHCHRMIVDNGDDSGEDCGSGPIVEDSGCKVYCHASHCTCPVACVNADGAPRG